jgi:peptide/nickel transport system permease protein
MTKFVLRRVLLMIPILLGVTLLIFILRAVTPGDPVDSLLSQNATPEQRAELREELGLNDPLVIQFFPLCKRRIYRGSRLILFNTSARPW